MIGYLLCIFAILVIAATLLKAVNENSIGYWLGILVGFMYFIGFPLVQLLIFGEIDNKDISGASLHISEDYNVLYVLLGTAISFFIFNLFVVGGDASEVKGRHEVVMNTYLVGTYFVLAVSVFVMSGKASGGHWIENYDTLYSGSVFAVIIGNFNNVLRVMFPGLLINLYRLKFFNYKQSIYLMLFFAIFELIVSSNRIIMLFSIMALFIIAYEEGKIQKFIFYMILVAPLLMQFNLAFPIIRGLLWSNGAEIGSAVSSVDVAYSTRKSDGSSMQDSITSLFESENLGMIKVIINEIEPANLLYFGETVYVKSLATFIPRVWWEHKPDSLSLRMAEYIFGPGILSLNSTLVGEAYANFGLAAIILLPINLYFMGRILMRVSPRYLHATLFYVAMAAWRFDFSFLVTAFIFLTIVSVVDLIVKQRKEV
jgi:hypothetical protein